MANTSTFELHRRINKTRMVLLAAVIAGAAFAAWIGRHESAAHAAAAQARAIELSAESRAICEKWGMAQGTQSHAGCVADLQGIRDRQARRFVDDFFP